MICGLETAPAVLAQRGGPSRIAATSAAQNFHRDVARKGTTAGVLGLADMEQQFGHIEGRNPIPSVFQEPLRRTYDLGDEPIPPKLEELVQRLPEAAQQERA